MELPFKQPCRLCPRACGVDRHNHASGFCRSDLRLAVSSICVHRGEEPPIGGVEGICNIFFAHCNLQCSYCQNHQISRNSSPLPPREQPLEQVIEEIIKILGQGISTVGFVSPSHMIPQMKQIIDELHRQNHFPTMVFNTNGYDSIDTLRTIASLVGVYLVDFKYSDPELAEKLSAARDYPQVALAAIQEMVSQKGIGLQLDQTGRATKGIIIRHLILPGYMENSIRVLRKVATDISNKINISLMAQFHPPPFTRNHEHLYRTISQREYDRVVAEMTALGFENGWIQELGSADVYRPDFDNIHPFE